MKCLCYKTLLVSHVWTIVCCWYGYKKTLKRVFKHSPVGTLSFGQIWGFINNRLAWLCIHAVSCQRKWGHSFQYSVTGWVTAHNLDWCSVCGLWVLIGLHQSVSQPVSQSVVTVTVCDHGSQLAFGWLRSIVFFCVFFLTGGREGFIIYVHCTWHFKSI